MAKTTCEYCQVVGLRCQEERNGRFLQIVFNAAETQRTVTVDGEKAFSTSIPISNCQVKKGWETPEDMVKGVKEYLSYQQSHKILGELDD